MLELRRGEPRVARCYYIPRRHSRTLRVCEHIPGSDQKLHWRLNLRAFMNWASPLRFAHVVQRCVDHFLVCRRLPRCPTSHDADATWQASVCGAQGGGDKGGRCWLPTGKLLAGASGLTPLCNARQIAPCDSEVRLQTNVPAGRQGGVTGEGGRPARLAYERRVSSDVERGRGGGEGRGRGEGRRLACSPLGSSHGSASVS